jgi:hypothetical protein
MCTPIRFSTKTYAKQVSKDWPSSSNCGENFAPIFCGRNRSISRIVSHGVVGLIKILRLGPPLGCKRMLLACRSRHSGRRVGFGLILMRRVRERDWGEGSSYKKSPAGEPEPAGLKPKRGKMNTPQNTAKSQPASSPRAKTKTCKWGCGRRTDRRCGICIYCIDERDERDRRIDAGLEAYIPPSQRPGHRFYERKASEAQKAALTRARVAKFTGQMRQAELLDADAGKNSASKVGELA